MMKTISNEERAYCESNLELLIRDHNHYQKVNYAEAVKDYRTAIEDLIRYAARLGVKIGYTVDKNGYLTMA